MRLRDRVLELAEKQRSFGSPHLHELLRREVFVQTHKLAEQDYNTERVDSSLDTTSPTKYIRTSTFWMNPISQKGKAKSRCKAQALLS